ncbi:uncharacterized protein LACBIDRAFT_307769 [Laccaria bicolor S238N-H82]|uniref:Predicted protein n=1 Tax=Laccaria bicolor (strain S238N-H82 / ATCC MYA-4686) TaxID=486041 RepID=B0DR01_LACBS|nr:uncharacterized protein LACBIDRAFT_307769 [Laccaria bicolor S238N-H82]EDR02978.1 predicted protein [Laccaria bicolor S238N-H82]|eukprot:XP_001886401.1 predicted protein [Laccaria bicolor S238N-H82]
MPPMNKHAPISTTYFNGEWKSFLASTLVLRKNFCFSPEVARQSGSHNDTIIQTLMAYLIT